MKREQNRKQYIVNELDDLFDRIIKLSREIREVEFTIPVFEQKVEDAIIKNFEKIGTNVLVAHKRAQEALSKETL